MACEKHGRNNSAICPDCDAEQVAKYEMTTERKQILALANKLNFPALNEWGKDLIEAFYHAARKPLEEQYASMTKSFFDAKAQLREALALESKWRVEATGLRQQLAAAQAREQQYRMALQKIVNYKNLKNEIEAIRFAGPLSYNGENWKEVALAKEREYIKRKSDAGIATCEVLTLPTDTSALEAMIAKAGEVMRERSATVCDKRSTYYGRASAESQEAKDCAFNIRALPGVKLEDLK